MFFKDKKGKYYKMLVEQEEAYLVIDEISLKIVLIPKNELHQVSISEYLNKVPHKEEHKKVNVKEQLMDVGEV